MKMLGLPKEQIASTAILKSIENVFNEKPEVIERLPGGWISGSVHIKIQNESFALKRYESVFYNRLIAIAESSIALKNVGFPIAAAAKWGKADDGSSWCLSKLINGHHVDKYTKQNVDSILKTISMQNDLAKLLHSDLCISDTNSLIDSTLRTDKPTLLAKANESASVVVDALMSNADLSLKLTKNDFVHNDMNRENTIVVEGITYLVDLDEMGAGSRVLDLAELYHRLVIYQNNEELRNRVAEEGVKSSGEDMFKLCLATTIIDKQDWTLKNRPSLLKDYFDCALSSVSFRNLLNIKK